MSGAKASNGQASNGRLWLRRFIALIALASLVGFVVSGFQGGFAPVALLNAAIVLVVLPGFLRNGASTQGDHCSRKIRAHDTEVKP